MRWGIRLLIVAVFMAVAVPRGANATGTDITLAVGQARFWPGAHVDDGSTTAPFSYALHLAGGGARLRVAIDSPSRDNQFTVDVINPHGATAASASNSNQFDAEAFLDKPEAGDWTVKVTPTQVTNGDFRMRAMLESAVPAMPSGHVAMLPNLKAVPPFEFGFVAPANPLNGLYPPDTANPGLDVAGVHPLSCAIDESAPTALGGQAAVRCLRLTSGPINVGSGPFDMRFDLIGDMAAAKASANAGNVANTVTGPMFQAVHFSDGKQEIRPAGTYSFHTTHGHFHTDQILTYELYKVTDEAKGGLVLASSGTKSGFCPADQLFGEWRKFSQRASGGFGAGDDPTGNCMSPYKGALGLSVGWGDVYRWQRPGQFVEFDGGDGLYVVRATVDKSNHVLEENDNDNTSYSYIRVTGDNVQLLERGQGLDPWDVHKAVFTGFGPASQDGVGGELAVAAPAPAPAKVDATTQTRDLLAVTGRDAPLALSCVLLALALAFRGGRRYRAGHGRDPGHAR